MIVVDQRTSKQHALYPTEEFSAALASSRAKFNCPHESKELRRVLQVNGSVHVKHICMRCGHRSLSVTRAEEHANLPVDDGSLATNFERLSRENYQAIVQRHLEIQLDRASSWQRRYDTYIKSDGWYQRRTLVLRRAKGVCEGCLTNPATQVHHTTYQHLGDEFLFELVAVCDACHSRLHESRSAEDRNEDEDGDTYF